MKKWNGEKNPWAGVKERSRPLITSPIPARCGKTETADANSNLVH